MKRLDPKRIRKSSAPCSLAALLLLTGCWFLPVDIEPDYKPFERSSLESLLGLKKKEVRQHLGNPSLILVGHRESYFLYNNYGDEIIIFFLFYLPMGWEKEPGKGKGALYCSMLEFGDDEVFKRFEIKSGRRSMTANDCKKLFWSSEELAALRDPLEDARKANQAQLRLKAEAGDSEAQYDMAYLAESGSAEQLMWARLAANQGHAEAQFFMAQIAESGSAEKLMWTCLAAHHGHAEAQHQMGQFYEEGRDPESQNLVAAYVWYGLAEINGFKETGSEYRKTAAGGWACCFPTRSRREILAEQLGSVQTAEAKRLVAEWTPDTSRCETASKPGAPISPST